MRVALGGPRCYSGARGSIRWELQLKLRKCDSE